MKHVLKINILQADVIVIGGRRVLGVIWSRENKTRAPTTTTPATETAPTTSTLPSSIFDGWRTE